MEGSLSVKPEPGSGVEARTSSTGNGEVGEEEADIGREFPHRVKAESQSPSKVSASATVTGGQNGGVASDDEGVEEEGEGSQQSPQLMGIMHDVKRERLGDDGDETGGGGNEEDQPLPVIRRIVKSVRFADSATAPDRRANGEDGGNDVSEQTPAIPEDGDDATPPANEGDNDISEQTPAIPENSQEQPPPLPPTPDDSSESACATTSDDSEVDVNEVLPTSPMVVPQIKREIDDDSGSEPERNPRQRTSQENDVRRRTPRWGDRALDKTTSVVQTLLNRQLGLPFFTRSVDLACNYHNETQICRHLLRTRAAEDRGGKSVTPPLVSIKQKRKKQNQLKRVASDWVQLKVLLPQKTEVCIVDNRIWIRSKQGEGPRAKFSEDFYSFEPSNFEFTLIGRANSTGKMKIKAMVDARSLSTAPKSTYLLTLTEPNIVRAYDVSKRKVTNKLELSLDIAPGVKAYTHVDVDDSTAKIFVMATGFQKKLVKVILILDYPPSWTKVGIIYVDELPLTWSIENGLCYLTQDQVEYLSTWPFVMKKVKPYSKLTGASPAPSLSVRFEGRLSEMPTLINTFRLHKGDEYGMLTAGVPLIYAAVKNGLQFFLPVHLPSLEKNAQPQPPIYEFQTKLDYQNDEIEVYPFPDDTPRAVICNLVSGEYEVVKFSVREVAGRKKVVSSNKSQPFKYWDEAKANRAAVQAAAAAASASSSQARSSRPRRACVKNITNLVPEKKSILGITFCPVLDLIGVLLADDEEFIVVLYDPLTLSVFKALPPVHAWPPGKHGDPNKKRESIQHVAFSFEVDFIFINMDYAQDCKPPREVFCFRLMAESESNC